MGEKESSYTVSVATVENSIEGSQKTKSRTIYDPAIPLLGIYLKETKILIQKDICILFFIAALFTVAKIWKQPKCPSADEWIKKMGYTYTMEYYSAIKGLNLTICHNMNGPGGFYAKWNKPDRERQILDDITDMCNLKLYKKLVNIIRKGTDLQV